MSLLTNLPEALLSSTLSVWLTIVDVAYIDSAICCHAHRKDFKKAAYRSHAVLQYPTTMTRRDVDCEELMRWIGYRGAVVTGFFTTLLFLLGHDSREEYLKKNGHAIRWIEFAHDYRFDRDCRGYRQVSMDVLQYCPNLIRLNAADCLEEEGLTKIVQRCPLLEELEVTGGSCTNAFVLELSKHCRALKCVGMMSACLEERCLLALVRSNPGLVSLNISAHGATENFLRELTLTCRGLTKLSLECFEITLAALSFVLSKCASLDFVYLGFCQIVGSDTATPNSAAAVTSASMRDLALSCVTIETDELDCLLRLCPGLTSLRLSHCEVLIGLEEMPIGTYCPSLETLIINDNMGAGGDELLLDISAHCPRLRVLKVPESFIESEKTLITLGCQCPLLEELDLSKSSVDDGCLFALAQFAVHLKVLKLFNCREISDVGVAAVMEGCVHLFELVVNKCKKVSKDMKKAVKEKYLESE